jgi:pimeloyl-ACP methyl ester carboxylesterase
MNMSQFLLIHGACHGAWCWHKAIPELEKRGHRAQAIDVPGQGQDQTPLGNVTLDTMADRVVTALTEIAGPVVLVGHSMAGMVISATAEKAPDRIKTLVFLCAFLPRDGESLLALGTTHSGEPSRVRKNMIVDADHISGTIMLDKVRDLFYHDCTDADVAYASARLRPQALGAHSTPVHLTQERFGRIPRVYVECTQDRALTIEKQRDMVAKSPPIDVRTLDSSHSPFLSMPDKLAATLMDL